MMSDFAPFGSTIWSHASRKNDALVEFALGDMTNQLFVSRYAVEMPKKQEMEAFLKQIGNELTDDLGSNDEV